MSEPNHKPSNWSLYQLISKRQQLVFLVVPLMLFTFLLFRMAEIHFFYQGWIDPVYAYLINGLTFALGSNDIGHVDHPGTPLQLFCALIIKLYGWMRGPNDLATDVLTNPESYLRIISLALITINCTLLWLLGHFAYKNLKNRSMAVALQLIPLLSFQVMNFMTVVACETVITLLSFALAACIILYDSQKEGRLKLLVVIAVLSALMVSTKISTLPILMIPFFFFEKSKSKATYLGLALFLILLFIFPVWEKLGNFTSFMGKMATHTGKYGSGEAKLFDMGIYLRAILQMLSQEFPFTLHLLLLPLGWVLIARRNIQGSLKRLYIAITVATLFQVMVVARHYSFHYLMHVFALLMPLHAYFWIQLFKEKIAALSARTVSIVVILLMVGVFTRLIVLNNFEEGITNAVDKTTQAVQSQFKGKYIILTDYNNDAALMDPALKFGYSYAGPTMKKRYAPILASVYPGNYLWDCRGGFTDWEGSSLGSEIFSANSKIYIYANTESCEVSMAKISEMVDLAGMSGLVKLENVYQNPKKGEVIALAVVDTSQLMMFNQPKMLLESTMEELAPDGDHLKSNRGEYTFRGGYLQSDRYARTGNKSILLTAKDPYGLNFSIPVSTGKRYKVEFWQRSSDQHQALLVAAASKNDIFYKTSPQGTNTPAEWTHTELKMNLPDDFPEASLQFYLWNPDSDSVWVDDFRLTVFE